MENYSSISEFYILPFFMKNGEISFMPSVIFFPLIYLAGILVNIIIITVICRDHHLHTPMYLFLCNLSCIDLCYTTITIPNLLYMMISGDNTMSLAQCCVQMYVLSTAVSAEIMVIFIMGFDRYVAICHPLYYHSIFNKKMCILITLFIWISAWINSYIFIISILKLVFCSSRTVHQFFCDAKALINISCSGTFMFYVVMYVGSLVYGLFLALCSLVSYVKIIRVILRIKSKEGRSKAFSTCSSHLTIMVIYFGSGTSVYMMPPSERYNVLQQILTIFYTIVTPTLNPLIYSLWNKEVKSYLRKLVVKFSQDYVPYRSYSSFAS